MKVSFGITFGSGPLFLHPSDSAKFMDLVRMAEHLGVSLDGS